jgi:DNA repair exonuclease SbcCD ATPase subunit
LQVIEAFRTNASPEQPLQADKDKEDADRQYSNVQDRLLPEASQLEPHATSSIEELPMSTVHTTAKTKQPKLDLEDWETMVQLMAKRGITGTTSEVFHAFVEIVKAGEVEQQRQQIRTMSELTASLSWFTDRIDALENTCQKLEQEREQLVAQSKHQPATQPTSEELSQLQNENTQLKRDVQELSRLQNENTQLKQDLQQTQSQLQGIQKLLGMGSTTGATAETQASAQNPASIAAATNLASVPELSRVC